MDNLFEYSDVLNSPIDAFYYKSPELKLPVLSHWHYFIELIYLLEGEITVNCNEAVFNLKSGDFILLPPQSIHSIHAANDEPFNYICIKFNLERIHLDGSYLPNLVNVFSQLGKMGDPPVMFKDGDLGKIELKEIFTDIVNEVYKREYGYDSQVYALLATVILAVLRNWHRRGISLESQSVDDVYNASIQNVLLYIDQHSNENINVDELAALCHMSYSYFAKLFHRYYGRSCKQYIEFVRLNKAENLLLFTDYDLNWIASELGFSDCSHLIRSFKKRYNLTPKQFRMKYKG